MPLFVASSIMHHMKEEGFSRKSVVTWLSPFYFLFCLFSLAIESFSNVVLINPWKSPKAEAIPNITTKLKPATIVTIQVPVPILSGTANNGLGIQKSITYKSTLESFNIKTKKVFINSDLIYDFL